jgi:hypothetical protein
MRATCANIIIIKANRAQNGGEARIDVLRVQLHAAISVV